MSRSIIPNGGNDLVFTPPDLAQQIVDYFDLYNPDKGKGDKTRLIEPCKGEGAFTDAFHLNGRKYHTNFSFEYCEITEGIDFLKYPNPETFFIPYRFDFVVSNPPFSKFRAFLKKSMEISDNVIFLSLVNAFFFKARFRDIKEAGFGFKEIVFVDTPPKPWPQMGIQLGVVHLQKGYKGDTKFTHGLPEKL